VGFGGRADSLNPAIQRMSQLGSFASVWPDHGDFRSTPVNGHSQDRRAIFRHGGLAHGTFVVAQGLAQHNKC
jgi:hypothetical protein